MTHRTHAVAKTRAHQVRWSSRCRSRTAGAGAGAAAGARGAAAAGRGRTTQLRLSSASTLVDGSPQLQRSSHALLRPQESKCSRASAGTAGTARTGHGERRRWYHRRFRRPPQILLERICEVSPKGESPFLPRVRVARSEGTSPRPLRSLRGASEILPGRLSENIDRASYR